MRNLLLFLTCLFALQLHAQQPSRITGSVRDENNEPMPFVNVGIPGCNGTVTDLQGNFNLEIRECKSSDTLRISMIGYKPYLRTLQSLTSFENLSLSLERSDYELREVKVKSRKLRNVEKGNFNQSTNMIAGFKSNDLGSELVVRIPVKRDAWIKKFNFFIANSLYDTLFFRLNVYKIENGYPGETVLHHPVYVTTRSKKGWVSVNLEPYNVMVEGDFAIGLEWIRDFGAKDVSKGLMFSVGLLNKSCYYRKASQQHWNKTGTFGVGFNVLMAE